VQLGEELPENVFGDLTASAKRVLAGHEDFGFHDGHQLGFLA